MCGDRAGCAVEQSVHLPTPHQVKKRSRAELNLLSMVLINSRTGFPVILPAREEKWISEIKKYNFNFKIL